MTFGTYELKILRFISIYPGSSFSDIMRTLGIHESTLRYHLEKYERDGRLLSKKIGKKRCYYSQSEEDNFQIKDHGLPVLQKRVFLLIENSPGISIKDITKSISISRSSATGILKSLMRKGKIVKNRSNNIVSFEIVSKKQLKDRIFRQMVIRMINGEIDEDVFKELVNEIDKRFR